MLKNILDCNRNTLVEALNLVHDSCNLGIGILGVPPSIRTGILNHGEGTGVFGISLPIHLIEGVGNHLRETRIILSD